MGKPTKDAPKGNVRYTEKWDGSTSAKVQLTALKLTMESEQSRAYYQAIAELEAATKELRVAKHSGESGWIGYAYRRQREANKRVVELQ